MLHWNIISSSRDSSFFYQSKSLIAWSWPCVNLQCFCGKSKIECKPKAACQSTTSIVACSKRKGLPLKHFRDISKAVLSFETILPSLQWEAVPGCARQVGGSSTTSRAHCTSSSLSAFASRLHCVCSTVFHQVAVRYIGIPAQGVTSYCACVSIAVRSSLTFRW